jgi:DNA-binding CsgD family transcriptional regulator
LNRSRIHRLQGGFPGDAMDPCGPNWENVRMKMQELAVTALAGIVRCLDPLILSIDLDGNVRDRVTSGACRVPTDFLAANSLRAMLSAPVFEGWMALVRESMARQESIITLAIVDGRGHAIVIEPQAAPDIGAFLVVFPSPMFFGGRRSMPGFRSLPLVLHEWGRLECLSRGQLDTLRSVTLGLTNEQIAARVFRTKRAIEWHIRFLNQQLGTTGREALACVGREAGLTSFTDEAWERVLQMRPSRRETGTPDVDDEPASLILP